MKSHITYLTIIMACLIPKVVLGQQQVEYRYDAAGNRTQRVIKMPSLDPRSQNDAPQTRSVIEEYETLAAQKPPQYEDMLGERKVIIYPNPTSGIIRIEFQGYSGMSDARLFLYNMQGKLILQENNVERSAILDLTPFPAGIYILHLVAGIERIEWKIIKE